MLNNVKSKKILKDIFKHLREKKKLNIVKHNKKFQVTLYNNIVGYKYEYFMNLSEFKKTVDNFKNIFELLYEDGSEQLKKSVDRLKSLDDKRKVDLLCNLKIVCLVGDNGFGFYDCHDLEADTL